MAKGKKPKLSEYTEDKALLICGLLAEGKSLRKICEENTDELPSRGTILIWLRLGDDDIEPYATFLRQYRRAREIQADSLHDDILDIADDDSQDVIFNDEGLPRINTEFIQRSKLKIEARFKLAAQMRPKKYGEKIPPDDDERKPTPVKVEIGVKCARKPDVGTE